MIVTALLGTSIAAVSGVAPAVNIPTGVLTAYLVCTALMTVRPLTPRSRRVSIGDLRVVRSGTLRGAPPPCTAPLAHVLCAGHCRAVVLHWTGEGLPEADPYPSVARRAVAGGARDDVLPKGAEA